MNQGSAHAASRNLPSQASADSDYSSTVPAKCASNISKEPVPALGLPDSWATFSSLGCGYAEGYH